MLWFVGHVIGGLAAAALVLGRARWIHDLKASVPSVVLLLLLPLALPAILYELIKNTTMQWCGGRSSVEPLREDEEVLGKSGTELAQMIRDGRLTSAELTAKCIARVNKVNGLINAVVGERFEVRCGESAVRC